MTAFQQMLFKIEQPRAEAYDPENPPANSNPQHLNFVFRMLAEWFNSEKAAIRFMLDHAGICIIIPPMDQMRKFAAREHIRLTLEHEPTITQIRRLEELHSISRKKIEHEYKLSAGTPLVIQRPPRITPPKKSRL